MSPGSSVTAPVWARAGPPKGDLGRRMKPPADAADLMKQRRVIIGSSDELIVAVGRNGDVSSAPSIALTRLVGHGRVRGSPPLAKESPSVAVRMAPPLSCLTWLCRGGRLRRGEFGRTWRSISKANGPAPEEIRQPRTSLSGVPLRTIITGRPVGVWYSLRGSMPSDW